MENKDYVEDIFQDTVVNKKIDEVLNTQNALDVKNQGVSPISKPIQSSNFKTNSQGWKLNSNGEIEANGARTVSTNFTPVIKAKGLTIYISDGTTPNGNLSGIIGDVCLNGPNGKMFSCTVTGTTWVSFT